MWEVKQLASLISQVNSEHHIIEYVQRWVWAHTIYTEYWNGARFPVSRELWLQLLFQL